MTPFGTGDRESPKDLTFVNKLYAVKDKNLSSVLTENNDLVDVTSDLLQDSSATNDQKTNLLNNLKTKYGWYITLENGGEKCLSETVIFGGSVYYSTFTPTIGNESDICSIGEGTARIYIVSNKTGNAVFNLDDSNDLDGNPVISRIDRYMSVGTGIPSGIILGIMGGTVTAYGGVGAGVFSPPLTTHRSLIPIHWRIIF